MADQNILASRRRTRRTDLHRLSTPFQIRDQMIDTGAAANLVPLGLISPAFLDADVMTARVALAPTTAAHYRGTRWVMQNNDDGTWSFLNQGQEENMLAGSTDSVTLGRALVEGLARFETTRWLIYHDLSGFRLRLAMRVSGWFGVWDDRLVLSNREEPAGPWLYWGIRPLPVETGSEPEALA